MKRLILSFLSVLMLFAISCNKEDSQEEKVKKSTSATSYNLVASLATEQVVGTISADGSYELNTDIHTIIEFNGMEYIVADVQITGSLEDGTLMVEFEADAVDGDDHLVHAYPIEPIGLNYGIGCPKETHSCSGCRGCAFKRNGKGCITGCECPPFPGCTHTVTTTQEYYPFSAIAE